MATWSPSPQYQKVAEANRKYYAKVAQLYDKAGTCTSDGFAQRILAKELDEVLQLLNHSPERTIVALDACGGSGNVSLKLLERNVDVLTCDISQELLEIFQTKAHAQGLQPNAVCSEIGSWLSNSESLYDLIVFCAALHHLENIEDITALAMARLKPGGMLFTTHDPVQRDKMIVKLLMQLDYVFFKLHRQWTDVPAGILRRLRRTISSSSGNKDKQTLSMADENLGVLAEYHVEKGIDDFALVRFLEAQGGTVIFHRRIVGSRYWFTRFLLSLVNGVTNFKLLVTKNDVHTS